MKKYMIIYKLATIQTEFTELFDTKKQMNRRWAELSSLYRETISTLGIGKVKLR